MKISHGFIYLMIVLLVVILLIITAYVVMNNKEPQKINLSSTIKSNSSEENSKENLINYTESIKKESSDSPLSEEDLDSISLMFIYVDFGYTDAIKHNVYSIDFNNKKYYCFDNCTLRKLSKEAIPFSSSLELSDNNLSDILKSFKDSNLWKWNKDTATDKTIIPDINDEILIILNDGRTYYYSSKKLLNKDYFDSEIIFRDYIIGFSDNN